MRCATDPRVVAEQAGLIAAAWSGPGAPRSWRLTAAQFEALRDDAELGALAAAIPPDKLPPLLFSAAATFLVLESGPEPLRGWFPAAGEPQPPLGAAFRREYREFCLDHRDRVLELCSRHRYQMNEAGRCADIVPALATLAGGGRDLVLVDVGTGAGLGLNIDRYRYLYRDAEDRRVCAGDPDSELAIEVELRGELPPAVPAWRPSVADRVGIDTEPLDLSQPGVRAWLAACVPQEAGAVTRFWHAVDIARRHPARTVRGDACDLLPGILAAARRDALVCVVDSYTCVFFPPDELERFRAAIDTAGRRRDLAWISVDPLVPMGNAASRSVIGLAAPPGMLERGRREGVFGVVGRLAYSGGRRERKLLALAHPGAAWLEWLPALTAEPIGPEPLRYGI
jgi:hypothetical protein